MLFHSQFIHTMLAHIHDSTVCISVYSTTEKRRKCSISLLPLTEETTVGQEISNPVGLPSFAIE